MKSSFENFSMSNLDSLSTNMNEGFDLDNIDSLEQIDNQFDALTNATILMVDDEPINTDVIKIFLKEEGYSRFISTHQADQAYDLIENHQPDLILLDLMMPKVNGFEILTRVRENKKLKHIPVIILTSSTEAENKLKALQLGANDFLGKPVDPSELVLRIRNTLAAKAYQDRLAYYDALTDLPNRLTFMNHLDWSLHQSKHHKSIGAVIKMDLDHFKEINDTLGPTIGDLLLKEISQRLKECLRFSDTIGRLGKDHSKPSLCRIGGNEFSVLFPAIQHENDILPIAQRIIETIERPSHPENHELYVTASIGIAIFPQDGVEINTILKHADIAMSHAKQQGGNCLQFYSNKLKTKSEQRLKLANDLRKAISKDELELYYQPKLSFLNENIVGAEALMRWNHSTLGLISPNTFIPLAEEIGLLPILDKWAFQTVCQQLSSWQDANVPLIPISVNITSQSFRKGRVIGTVQEVLNNSTVNPKYIKLELTESSMMENVQENIEVLHKLKEMGFSISIDDFGTGYSSLSYLNRFPIDELKIDRSFITGIFNNAGNLSIVKAIIAMSHGLDLNVVAEGIETKDQLNIINSLDCNEWQGFLFSKPVPVKEFIKLLQLKI